MRWREGRAGRGYPGLGCNGEGWSQNGPLLVPRSREINCIFLSYSYHSMVDMVKPQNRSSVETSPLRSERKLHFSVHRINLSFTPFPPKSHFERELKCIGDQDTVTDVQTMSRLI